MGYSSLIRFEPSVAPRLVAQHKMILFHLAPFFFLFGLVVSSQNPTVDLGYTKYQGKSLPNGISQWLGIRYAAAPTGSLRFSAPRDPDSVEGVQDAFKV